MKSYTLNFTIYKSNMKLAASALLVILGSALDLSGDEHVFADHIHEGEHPHADPNHHDNFASDRSEWFHNLFHHIGFAPH